MNFRIQCWSTALIPLLLIGIALSASAEITAEKVGGRSAKKLYAALSDLDPPAKPKPAKKGKAGKKKPKAKKAKKVSKKKAAKKVAALKFKSIDCVFQGPGDTDPCHACLAHHDKQGKACQSCEEVAPKYPEACRVDGADRELSEKQRNRLADALRDIPTGLENGENGKFTRKIENVNCRKEPEPFCRYSFLAPEASE